MITRKKVEPQTDMQQPVDPTQLLSFVCKIQDMAGEAFPEISIRLKKYMDKDGIDKFLQRKYVCSNIPEKYFDIENYEDVKNNILTMYKESKSFDDNDYGILTTELRKVDSYLKSLDLALKKGTGLFIHGTHGSGKSTISIMILKKAISLNYRCFFWDSHEIIRYIKSTWKDKTETRASFIEYIFETVDFFVIDDFARILSYNSHEDEMKYLDGILSARNKKNLVTILTSNLSFEETKEKYGQSFYQNLKESLINVKIFGGDYTDIKQSNLLNELRI